MMDVGLEGKKALLHAIIQGCRPFTLVAYSPFRASESSTESSAYDLGLGEKKKSCT